MMRDFPYPPSFPNAGEEKFLHLILSSDDEFPSLWDAWHRDVVFDDIDSAMVRLLPLLSLRLSAQGIEGGLVRRIHGVYKFAWFKNQQLLDAVYSVVAICKSHNIPVTFLKGIPMLLLVYQNTGAMILGDADLLIKSNDALKLFQLLRTEGWQSGDPLLFHIKKFGLDAVTHATTFVNKAGIRIEIHWHVYHLTRSQNIWKLLALKVPEPPDVDDYLWEHAEPIMLRGLECSRLSLEDMLVHVIVHGAEGGNRRSLRWVSGAVWIIKNSSLNWGRVLESAERGGYIFDMQIAVRYLTSHFGVVFPPSFLEALNAKKVPRSVIRKYYKLSKVHYQPLGNFPHLWYRYWLYESEGSVWSKIHSFPRYLRIAWKIPLGRSMFLFVLKKYAERAGKVCPFIFTGKC